MPPDAPRRKGREQVLRDSDTVGFERGDKLFPIRRAHDGKPSDVKGERPEPQTGRIWVFHQTADLDDSEIVGPRSNRPPPHDHDNTRTSDLDTLKNENYSFHAGK